MSLKTVACVVCHHLAKAKARFDADATVPVNLYSEVYNSLMFGVTTGLGHRTPGAFASTLCDKHASALLRGCEQIKEALPGRDIFLEDPDA